MKKLAQDLQPNDDLYFVDIDRITLQLTKIYFRIKTVDIINSKVYLISTMDDEQVYRVGQEVHTVEEVMDA